MAPVLLTNDSTFALDPDYVKGLYPLNKLDGTKTLCIMSSGYEFYFHHYMNGTYAIYLGCDLNIIYKGTTTLTADELFSDVTKRLIPNLDTLKVSVSEVSKVELSIL